MAEKINYYRSYGEKLISLFVRLLFSGETYSLTELSRMLDCSKQTVLRLIDDIDLSYNVKIEQSKMGNRHYYRIRRPERTLSLASISEMELMILQMCRDFTAQLLGKRLFEEASMALIKSQTLASGKKGESQKYFATIRPGTIDYTPHHDTIHSIIAALKEKRICRITYKAITDAKTKTYEIIPLKLFSHKDTVYLHARKVGSESRSDYDPLLAIHRVKKLELTDKRYEPPRDYDFEEFFNAHFGIMKDDAFQVEVEFTGWAAKYVAERIWSPDQKITKKGKDKIALKLTASSEAEVISWLLWFGAEATIISPKSLVNEIKNCIKDMQENYNI